MRGVGQEHLLPGLPHRARLGPSPGLLLEAPSIPTCRRTAAGAGGPAGHPQEGLAPSPCGTGQGLSPGTCGDNSG